MADATSRLFVQDLPPHCDESALRTHFAQYGVTDVQIPRRKSDKKKGRGFAFVGLKDADSAQRAVKALNGAYWRTSKLRVAPAAKRKAPQPPAPPPTKKKKVQKPPQQERRTQTKRERFLELRDSPLDLAEVDTQPIETILFCCGERCADAVEGNPLRDLNWKANHQGSPQNRIQE